MEARGNKSTETQVFISVEGIGESGLAVEGQAGRKGLAGNLGRGRENPAKNQ
jgi:hypothetical protein